MTERWPLVPLSEVLIHDRDYVEPKPQVYSKLSVKLYGKGVVLDAPADGATLRMQRHQVAKAGQVILSEIWGKKGAIGIVPREGDGALCTTHFFLFDIRLGRVDPSYLQAVFSSNYLEPQLNAEAKGTTGYAAVRPQQLLTARIPLPALPEQRRIVARLTVIDRHLTELESLYREVIRDREPVARVCIRELLSQGRERRAVELSELVTVRGGGTPSTGDPRAWEGSIPWITPKDMKTLEINNSLEHISEIATQSSPAKVIQPGAVLIVVRGMILARRVPVAILRVSAAVNQDMKALIPDSDMLPEFLALVLWAQEPELLDLVERSTHDTRKLKTESLLKVRIAIPALSDQAAMVSRSQPILKAMKQAFDIDREVGENLEALRLVAVRHFLGAH